MSQQISRVTSTEVTVETQPTESSQLVSQSTPSNRTDQSLMIALFAIIYGSMMLVGAVHYHECSDTRMALYTVVQGAVTMVNCVMLTLSGMCRCDDKRHHFFYRVGVFIFILTLGWSIVGFVWIDKSPCYGTVLYNFALGGSILMWIVLAIIIICNRCSDSNKDMDKPIIHRNTTSENGNS